MRTELGLRYTGRMVFDRCFASVVLVVPSLDSSVASVVPPHMLSSSVIPVLVCFLFHVSSDFCVFDLFF